VMHLAAHHIKMIHKNDTVLIAKPIA
jgi:hypothetical protein